MIKDIADEEEDFENDFEDDFEEDFEDDDDFEEDDDDDEYDDDEDDDFEEDEIEEKEEKEKVANEESDEFSEVAIAAVQPVPEEEKLSAVSPNEIPLSLVVEIGRLKMSMQTLMDLKPGNMIELDVFPESGIDLVVNGSRVAKGELLQIGENLGIRILELS